jgi:hypothetical protein
MSLDLSVLMKERLTKERLTSLHAFLTKEGFKKEKITGSSFCYFSTKPNISIDVYLTKAPMKGDDFWDNVYENGKSVNFPPKSEITLESRHTEASHLKSYSLAKALARRFGGIVMNHPAASCGVSLKDTETALERSKLRGTDPKRDSTTRCLLPTPQGVNLSVNQEKMRNPFAMGHPSLLSWKQWLSLWRPYKRGKWLNRQGERKRTREFPLAKWLLRYQNNKCVHVEQHDREKGKRKVNLWIRIKRKVSSLASPSGMRSERGLNL